MATVNKNFRIKHGLVVEGATGTIDGNNILTETASDTYILNLIGGETLVKSVSGNLSVDGAGDLSIDTEGLFDTLVTDGLATSSSVTTALGDYTTTSNLDTTVGGYGYLKNADLPTMYGDSDVDNHLYGTGVVSYNNGQITVDIDSLGGIGTNEDGLIVNRGITDGWYDAAGLASTAQQNAENYADGLASNYDAAGAAATAEGAANEYTDTALESYTPTSSLDTTVGGYGYLKSADLSGYATESYVGTAIDNLVDGAPGLLDTLNEIAAAINDDENYATTMTTALSGKQNNLTAGSNIDITSDTISVTGLDTDDVSEGENLYFTDERAIDAVSGADIYPNAVIIDNVAKQVAFTTGNITPAAATTALAWAKADYRSGKFTVKVKSGIHTEISEVLVTLDTADNIAITEYGIVGTNGTLAAVTADISGTDVRVRVTPVNDNSEVMVVGTLLI